MEDDTSLDQTEEIPLSAGGANDWKPPSDADEFQEIRACIVELGHSGEDFDTLCFAIGAVPSLYGHARVLENLDRIFKTPYFRDAVKWRGPWVHLPAWRKLLRAWPRVRQMIRDKYGVESDWLDPLPAKSRGRSLPHPLRRHGMTQGPIPSMLAVSHPLAMSFDPNQRKRAEPFDLHQATFLRAAIDIRWASGDVAGYLSFCPPGIYPPGPQAEQACRSIRYFSELRHTSLVARLPRCTDPRRYIEELERWAETLKNLEPAPRPHPQSSELTPAALQDDQKTEVTLHERALAIVRYLVHWEAGSDTKPSRRRRPVRVSVEDGGGSSPIDGFTLGAPTTLELTPPIETPPQPLGPTTTSGNNSRPQGTRPWRLPLYDRDKIRGPLSALRWQRMHIAMSDVRLPSDLVRLSPRLTRSLALHATNAVLDEISTDLQLQGPVAFGALLTRMSLEFGQQVESIHRTRIACLLSDGDDTADTENAPRGYSLEHALREQVDGPVLLLRQSTSAPESEAALPSVIGFIVPAVTPYRQGDDDHTRQNDHRVQNMLLPAMELGSLVLQWYLRIQGGTTGRSAAEVMAYLAGDGRGAHAFLSELTTGKHPPAAIAKLRMREYLAQLAIEPGTSCVTWTSATLPPSAPPGWSHWSLTRLASLLGDTIESQTGDLALAWQVTSRQDTSHEARLYYTQIPLDRVARTWLDAVQRAGLRDAAGSWEVAEPQLLLDHTLPRMTESPSAPSEPWLESWLQETRVSRFVIGSRFVVTLDEQKAFLRAVEYELSQPWDIQIRSERRMHHHARLVYVNELQGLTTGMRPTVSPVTLMRALEQHDRVDQCAHRRPSNTGIWAGVGDKDGYYSQWSRLAPVYPIVADQIRCLRTEQQKLGPSLFLLGKWPADPRLLRAMCRLDEQSRPAEVSVGWIEGELRRYGYDWPANHARGLLRTHLASRGCAPGDVDTLLGHHPAGGGAINMHSTFDFKAHSDRLRKASDQLLKELGLGSTQKTQHKPDEHQELHREPLLAPMHRAGPVGYSRGHSRPRRQDKPRGLSPIWDRVHTRATTADRRELRSLLRLLGFMARRGSTYATVMLMHAPALRFQLDPNFHGPPTNSPEPTGPFSDLHFAESAHTFFADLTKLAEATTRSRFLLAASWFRLLGLAWYQMDKQGLHFPAPPQVAINRPQPSPFTENAVLVAPIVEAWRDAILQWTCVALPRARAGGGAAPNRVGKPDACSEEGWACALVMSAVLNGLLLDRTALSMLLRRFCDGPRDLPLATGARRAHLDLELPGTGAIGRQLRRWWFDPITQAIWQHAPRFTQKLTLGSITPWLRIITVRNDAGLDGSVTWPLQPQSFGDLIRCAELWWLLRASRSVVATQSRRIDSSSIQTTCLGRLTRIEKLVAPATAQPPASGSSSASSDTTTTLPIEATEHEQLAVVPFVKTHTVEADADLMDSEAKEDVALSKLLHAAHPWLQPMLEVFDLSAEAPPSSIDPHALRSLLPSEAGPIAEVLMDFTQWLLEPVNGFKHTHIVRNTLHAAAFALFSDIGDMPDAQIPDARRLAGLILSTNIRDVEGTPAQNSQSNALLRFARFRGCDEEVRRLVTEGRLAEFGSAVDGTNDGDQKAALAHADARVLSFDEFEDIVQRLQDARGSLGAVEREVAALLLTLCFRLGLRPDEAYGMRLRDLVEDFIYVLPYEGHPLKSLNAPRRVPIEVFMRPDEIARLQAFAARRRAAGARNDDMVFGMSKADRARISGFVHAVMRNETEDLDVILYHARHSFASWLSLALFSIDYPDVCKFFDNMPMTEKFLKRGPELQILLFGSSYAGLGKANFGLARLVGHIGPAITHLHYLHFSDVMQAVIVEREAMRLPNGVWQNVMGKGRSTTFEIRKGQSDARELMTSMCEELKWKCISLQPVRTPAAYSQLPRSSRIGTVDPQVLKRKKAGSAPAVVATAIKKTQGHPDWVDFDVLLAMTVLRAEAGKTTAKIAAKYGYEAHSLETAQQAMRVQLPRAAQPGKAARLEASEGRVAISMSEEKRSLALDVEGWMRTRSVRDADGLYGDLDFLLNCYDRNKRDFQVSSKPNLKRLVRLFRDMGFRSECIHLVVRNTMDVVKLPGWMDPSDLGPFQACEIEKIAPKRDVPSYTRRLGFAPLTPEKKGCGHALALVAAFGLVTLEAFMGIRQACHGK